MDVMSTPKQYESLTIGKSCHVAVNIRATVPILLKCPSQMYHIPMAMLLVPSIGMSLGHSLSEPSDTLITPLFARFSRLILASSFLAKSICETARLEAKCA